MNNEYNICLKEEAKNFSLATKLSFSSIKRLKQQESETQDIESKHNSDKVHDTKKKTTFKTSRGKKSIEETARNNNECRLEII